MAMVCRSRGRNIHAPHRADRGGYRGEFNGRHGSTPAMAAHQAHAQGDPLLTPVKRRLHFLDRLDTKELQAQFQCSRGQITQQQAA